QNKIGTIEAGTLEWRQVLEGFYSLCQDAMNLQLQKHPGWTDPCWQNCKLPVEFPDTVYIGKLKVDLKKLNIGSYEDDKFKFPDVSSVNLPAILSFPERGSMFLSATPANRNPAIDRLLNTALRLLTSFPPGKAQFTIIDPVGLGQNFSALMHLADYDESLVGRRIWTEQLHIERRLSELTEHIEKVIQKYLRNRYASIAEYNLEAGEMTEAYHFLVIADFPTGFSELALDRLASIVTSGVRCGVYTLIMHDKTQKLPAIETAKLRRNGLIFTEHDNRLIINDDHLRKSEFDGEGKLDAETFNLLLQTIGQQCQDAKRVEVPFSMVIPQEHQFWSSSTDKNVRVPLGRAGADRLQFLDLGLGTSQHALISGKTGSGKSTIFHVMITNLALWFSPDEVEFYLIDFKKGVEFKIYANNRLPHARVIAIESEREFGLSVLQHIDKEFERRAELFRNAAVQDIPNYRNAGTGEYLPRIVLIIDEFQEFFTEDDAIAQNAALLLDRIVRQGRAFGVHAILGSQTLGGAFTLAKSTMGQMGVRIALQCNEADSYLILSDDNGAARLLSRPGEAIYNDMSGLVEGNNPFQVVWLSDKEEEVYLQKIQEKSTREKGQYEPPIIFEGNVSANLGNNMLLKDQLAGTLDGDGGRRIWLGEPNAIKSPTEVRFLPQGGSNLLIVGQRSESALATCYSAIISLMAASQDQDDFSIIICDGSKPESEQSSQLLELANAAPQATLVSYREIPRHIEQLEAEVQARLQGDNNPDKAIYLIVFGLQRFRQLRQSDDFDYAMDEDEKLSTAKCFSNILTEGPAQNVYTIVWCDSLNNLNRTFTRKTLREFEMRMLYQMSASDSAELIDLPHASKLGLYKALLYNEETGTVENFRPYAIPDDELMTEIKNKLQAKYSVK
ncbi:FtsK/SpoIIIE domain-containing protein, partial [Planctomycetota bacterium]